MAFPPHAADWMARAEIDYLGPFVKAWAAFNAWYREASGKTLEREMLSFVINHANSTLRRRVLPLLDDNNGVAEAQALKQAICDLQLRFDAIQFEVTRKSVRERVSLRTVCIRARPLANKSLVRNRYEYRVQKIAGGAIRITVQATTNNQMKFDYTQDQYDPDDVYGQQTFTTKLSTAQQTNLTRFYDGCNPRPLVDLVRGGGPPLSVGTMHLQCTPDELLAGLVETIYVMRNALLHGEVDPDPQVLACYEPAYRIVMKFLEAIRA